AGAGRVVQGARYARSGDLDVAPDLPRRAENERIRARSAPERSGGPAYPCTLNVEGVGGALSVDRAGDAGSIEGDRRADETVGGVELDGCVLDCKGIIAGDGRLAIDRDRPAIPGEAEGAAAWDCGHGVTTEGDAQARVAAVGSHD